MHKKQTIYNISVLFRGHASRPYNKAETCFHNYLLIIDIFAKQHYASNACVQSSVFGFGLTTNYVDDEDNH